MGPGLAGKPGILKEFGVLVELFEGKAVYCRPGQVEARKLEQKPPNG
jgi:hypothetical protein